MAVSFSEALQAIVKAYPNGCSLIPYSEQRGDIQKSTDLNQKPDKAELAKILECKVLSLLESAGDNGLSVRELQRKVFYGWESQEVIEFMGRMMMKYRPVTKENVVAGHRPTYHYFYTAPVQGEPEAPIDDESDLIKTLRKVLLPTCFKK